MICDLWPKRGLNIFESEIMIEVLVHIGHTTLIMFSVFGEQIKSLCSMQSKFLDANSHLTAKPYIFNIKCQCNWECYDQHGLFDTKFMGGQSYLFTVGGFFNRREYYGADSLDLLVKQ